MNSKRNPVHKKGNRNVLCPHYGDCLDHAIEKAWDCWDCCDCEHRFSQETQPEIRSTVSGSIAYYDLPLDIFREI